MDIVRVNCSIWTKGTAYPTDSSNILRLPFQLPLPLDVPPSCRFEQKPFFGPERKGDIAYFVEVVGVRNGVFATNIRLLRPFAVVARDPAGLAIKTTLEAGITGTCTTVVATANVHKGIFSDSSKVRMEVSRVPIP